MMSINSQKYRLIMTFLGRSPPDQLKLARAEWLRHLKLEHKDLGHAKARQGRRHESEGCGFESRCWQNISYS